MENKDNGYGRTAACNGAGFCGIRL
jgi:hypothetical protein